MTRFLYCFLLKLHPKRFRARFGDEILAVYDEARPSRSGASLTLSLVRSLIRQRLLRPPLPDPRCDFPLSDPLRTAWTTHQEVQKLEMAVVWTSQLFFIAAWTLLHTALGWTDTRWDLIGWPAVLIAAAVLQTYVYWRRQIRTPSEFQAETRTGELRDRLSARRNEHSGGWRAVVGLGCTVAVAVALPASITGDLGYGMSILTLTMTTIVLYGWSHRLSTRLTRLIQQEADILEGARNAAG